MRLSAHFTRRLVGTAAAFMVLATGLQPGTARADGRHGIRSVQFTASSPVLVGGDFGCDPTDPTRCGATYRNVRTLSGDFTGSTYQVGSAVLLPDGTYQGAGVQQFTGTVEGCGSGTLVIVETGFLDPSTGDTWGSWEIAPGQGTGDLAGLSGSLSADSRISATTSGTIRCR